MKKVIFGLSLVWALYQLALGLYPLLVNPWQHLVLHLGFAIVLGSLLEAERSKRRIVRVLYPVMAGAFVAASGYLIYHAERIQLSPGIWTTMDAVMAGVVLAILLEATRISFGWVMVIINLFFMVWGVAGNQLPGFLRNAGFPVEDLVPSLVLSGNGVFGTLLGSSAQYTFLFVLFGALLLALGGGDTLTDLASRLVGWTRGGAGKIAVASSFFFGMASGSTTANVSTTGSLTIPIMKRSGLSSSFAAGIESAAAVGGQIMPPVMGTTAFLIADILGMPYGQLVKHAFIPGALYYLSLFVAVDEEAAVSGLTGIDRQTLPSLGTTLRQGWIFIASFAVLFYLLLVLDISAALAGALSTLVMIVLYLITKRTAEGLRKVVSGLVTGAQNAVKVAVITASIGIVMGMVLKTGMGVRIASTVVSMSGDSVILMLLLTAIAIIILGSGLPSTATYVILLVLVVSSLTQRGIDPLLSHMFIFYWGVMSDISPPTMATVYIASSIADSPIGPTSVAAMRLASAGMIVPFIFVLEPELILARGTVWQQIMVVTLVTIGIIALSKGLTRLSRDWRSWRAWLLVLGGIGIMLPDLSLRAMGSLVLVLPFVLDRLPGQKNTIGILGKREAAGK